MKSESNYEDIIKKNLQIIAKREGISEEKVREDILYAISLALKSDDPKVREFWKLIPCKGESPTVDETLNYLIMKAASENIWRPGVTLINSVHVQKRHDASTYLK